MPSKELMAWCPTKDYDNILAQHLLNVALVAFGIKGIRKRIEILAHKASMINLAKESEILTLILSSLLLHDIGKACSKYQDNIRVKNDMCKASFRYHEVISAILLSKGITEDKHLRELLGEELVSVIVYAALSHHQAMSERSLEILSGDRIDLASQLTSSCGEVLVKELSNSLLKMSANLPRALSRYVSYEVIDKTGKALKGFASSLHSSINLYEEFLKLYDTFGSREGGYGIVRDFVDKYDQRIWQVAYITSGVVMVSDTLAAVAERGGKVRGLARHLLRELNITIDVIKNVLKY